MAAIRPNPVTPPQARHCNPRRPHRGRFQFPDNRHPTRTIKGFFGILGKPWATRSGVVPGCGRTSVLPNDSRGTFGSSYAYRLGPCGSSDCAMVPAVLTALPRQLIANLARCVVPSRASPLQARACATVEDVHQIGPQSKNQHRRRCQTSTGSTTFVADHRAGTFARTRRSRGLRIFDPRLPVG